MIRIALALAAMLAVTSAQAEPQCMPWQAALAAARAQWGELPKFVGTTKVGVVTMTVNDADGSWTLFIQPNPEIMCVIASGRDWMPAPPSVRDAVPAPPLPAPEQQIAPSGGGWPAFLYQIGG
ncbi:MAG: hypothetical protein NUV34_06230 [Sulfuricaulis sp.]|nr:hypothetical protein [Sulfuricaulis sp.]